MKTGAIISTDQFKRSKHEKGEIQRETRDIKLKQRGRIHGVVEGDNFGLDVSKRNV